MAGACAPRRRTNMSAANSARAEAPDAPWPELDRRFLQGDRRVAPPFPLKVIAAPWRPWIEGRTGLDLPRLHRPGSAGVGVGGLRVALRGRCDGALARAARAVA